MDNWMRSICLSTSVLDLVVVVMMMIIIIIQLFIIYVLSQQLYGQLQTQHSVHVSNYIVEQYNIAKGKLQASTGENTY
jgi:hypothetical protein